MSSKLFAAVLALLKRDAARMVELLKGHLQASLSGPSYEHMVESAERKLPTWASVARPRVLTIPLRARYVRRRDVQHGL